jgi:hypothetical protein
MSWLWSVLAFLAGLIIAPVLGDLFSEEIRSRLDDLPFAILQRASRRLPAEIRDEVHQGEWLPELHYILRGKESRPVTRLIHGTRFALGIWRGAARIGAGLTGRPVPVRPGPARLLRAVAGVDERVLDWVPHERVRYTALGFSIVYSAVIAGASFAAAISLALWQLPWWLMLLAGLGWGAFSLVLERWLIASTHGRQSWLRRLGLLVPRLVLSVVLGMVITEPIVLTVFEPAISAEITRQHTAYLADYEAKLRLCNPVPQVSVLVAATGCEGYDLPVALQGTAKAIEAKLAEKRAEVSRDDGLLARISAFRAVGQSNPLVPVAGWLVRLLLFMMLMGPITAQLARGITGYDRLVTARLESARGSYLGDPGGLGR